MNWFEKYPETLKQRIDTGEIVNQKYWKYIKELNSFSEERLNSTALICDNRKLSYRQMFTIWDRFAEILTALGITEENKSRIAMISMMNFDCINMIYAANMTGASVSITHPMFIRNEENYEALLKVEGITDLVLASDVINAGVLRRIIDTKKKLNINNVIVYHCIPSPDGMGGKMRQNHKDHEYLELKKVDGVLFLDDLKEEYIGTPVYYASDYTKDGAVVFHTSGTTSGIHKPVPLSDMAFNESAARLLRDDRFSHLKSMITLMTMEPISAYAACDMMHVPLSYGGTVVMLTTSPGNPETLKTIIDNRISVIFTGTVLFELLMKLPIKPDFSSLELIFLGGSYVSVSTKKSFRTYLNRCGCHAKLYVGYGLTEAGGAVLLSEADSRDDSVGKPLSGIKVKILDEEENQYYDLSDGARTGVLCISTKSLSSGKLDDKVFFELTDVDGEQYLNTYDLVDANENGDMRVIGRMNKFFVNNEGIRFDAGLVETAVSGEPGIKDCGLVPEYNKIIHDTSPTLYVMTEGRGRQAEKTVRDALFDVFVRDGKIVDSNLPAKAVIADKLPYTHTGKVDIHQIQRDHYPGIAYFIEPVRRQGRLADIKLLEYDRHALITDGGVPEELQSSIANMIEKEGGMTGRLPKQPSFLKGGPAADPMGMPLKGEPDLKMLCSMVESGTIDPEMLGHMLARMLIEQEEKMRKRNIRHMKRRRGDFRGC